jgi:hypothetical protein
MALRIIVTVSFAKTPATLKGLIFGQTCRVLTSKPLHF